MEIAGAPDAAPSSYLPASSGAGRLKLLCSYGGRILLRPSDGALKYVGGETRLLVLPRSVSFAELKQRMEDICGGKVAAIKYQLPPEDLDVLVSVTSDEDLAHMCIEYDLFRSAHRSPPISPHLRVFIFLLSASASQQRRQLASVPVSAANSPRATGSRKGGGLGKMPRVRSTPNLGGSLGYASDDGYDGLSPPPYESPLHQPQPSRSRHHQHHDHHDLLPPHYHGGHRQYDPPSVYRHPVSANGLASFSPGWHRDYIVGSFGGDQKDYAPLPARTDGPFAGVPQRRPVHPAWEWD